MFIEKSITRQSDRLRYRSEGDATAPTHVADEIPGMPIGDIIQNLPDHNPCAFESGFPVGNEWVYDDMLAQFEPLVFAVQFTFHAVNRNSLGDRCVWQAARSTN